MKNHWWKILGVILVGYSLYGGLMLPVPNLPILNETVRNLYFHVPMWFSMIVILGFSCGYSINFLKTNKIESDHKAIAFANVGILLGVLGLTTGAIWAKFTWGAYWSGDPKQNASAIGLLIYLAYIILRGSLPDPIQKARISAVYNIFAYAILIPLLFILPRYADSLHPGNGGNPGFNAYDLDNRMRLIFYPAVIGWILISCWIAQVDSRIKKIEFER